MISFYELADNYWEYYLSLEKQFIETKRYVEIDLSVNGETYSLEYLKLFQAVCSEIDVVGKALASLSDPSFVNNRKVPINKWWYSVSKKYPNLKEMVYTEKRKGDRVAPWENYSVEKKKTKKRFNFVLSGKAKTPSWWSAYNSVKHHRIDERRGISNYEKANLKNLFNALTALYSLEVCLLESTFDLTNEQLSHDKNSVIFTDKLGFISSYLSSGWGKMK